MATLKVRYLFGVLFASGMFFLPQANAVLDHTQLEQYCQTLTGLPLPARSQIYRCHALADDNIRQFTPIEDAKYRVIICGALGDVGQVIVEEDSTKGDAAYLLQNTNGCNGCGKLETFGIVDSSRDQGLHTLGLTVRFLPSPGYETEYAVGLRVHATNDSGQATTFSGGCVDPLSTD